MIRLDQIILDNIKLDQITLDNIIWTLIGNENNQDSFNSLYFLLLLFRTFALTRFNHQGHIHRAFKITNLETYLK